MVIRTAWYENKHFVRAKAQKGGQTCQKSGQMSCDGIKSKKNAFKSHFDMKKRTKPGIFQWFVRLLYNFFMGNNKSVGSLMPYKHFCQHHMFCLTRIISLSALIIRQSLQITRISSFMYHLHFTAMPELRQQTFESFRIYFFEYP